MPTFITLALALIQGVGLMALVTMSYGYVERLGVPAVQRALLHGLGFGVGAVFCLILSSEFQSGVFIDARNLFIAFSAAFCGPAAMAVTLAMAAAARLAMGGAATYAGLLGLVIAGSGGLFWRCCISVRTPNRNVALALLGGLTAVSLLSYLILPSQIYWPLLVIIVPPFIAVDLMGALVLGSFIEREQRLLKREQALEVDAFTDPLTALLNRRRFENLTSRILEVPDASSRGVALIVADIDHFKRVNDAFGHDAGDAVLKGVAMKLSMLVRSKDLASRMGGEEFAMVVHDVDHEGAAAMAERIRAAIASTVFETAGGKLTITISLGVKHCTAAAAFLDCYRRADAALYLAKARGRNRIEMAENPALEHNIARAA